MYLPFYLFFVHTPSSPLTLFFTSWYQITVLMWFHLAGAISQAAEGSYEAAHKTSRSVLTWQDTGASWIITITRTYSLRVSVWFHSLRSFFLWRRHFEAEPCSLALFCRYGGDPKNWSATISIWDKIEPTIPLAVRYRLNRFHYI